MPERAGIRQEVKVLAALVERSEPYFIIPQKYFAPVRGPKYLQSRGLGR